MERLPHLLIKDSAFSSRYTTPSSGGGGGGINTPHRDRQSHTQRLLNQVEQIQQQESELIQKQKAFGLDVSNGIYLAFESEQGFELKFQSLDFQPSGIELCTVKEVDNQIIATVFVPEGKLTHFLKKITQYKEENTANNNPKNKDLVESINAIKLAALEALWTDDLDLLPTDSDAIWWEAWLRCSTKIDYEAFLRAHAHQLDMKVSKESIKFLDRTVILVYGTKQQMSRSINLLGSIAEIRKAKDTADFFTNMNRIDQQEWINNTVDQLTAPSNNAPSICILDTGLNEAHPLLAPATKGTHTYNPTWGTFDTNGHGTSMSGLALYGDLTEILATTTPFNHTHWLESVKIISNANEQQQNHLYGAITRESIARVEIEDSLRQRIYCMAVSAPKDRDRGRPSSWSAAIDAITSGYEDEQQRLVVLSAGNTDSSYRHQYPENNITDEVHDPAQSWNALTVGGYTEKVLLNTIENPGWTPIAQSGDLSPASCTSMNWQKTWPIKPDIVMEAGNMAINPAVSEQADYIDDSLQLLSTGHNFLTGKQLVSFGDTSAAAALAINLAAKLQAQYPEYWPETIRALMVHSAEWTPAMKNRFAPLSTKEKYRQLLRYCGYGTPNEQALFWSAKNELTLVAQDTLQPYFKEDGKVKTRDINLHELPWPSEVLQSLPADTQVEMKVTLSYFIEPNPGSRGWTNKYRYASHGLRFDVRKSLEPVEQFKQRINQYARDEEYQSLSISDSDEWLLGGNLRGLGSVHSDIWTGSASALAEKGFVAVYPVIGWWKERANFERWGKQARYSLVVSIKTPEVETDIYTAVKNKISVPVVT